MNRQLMGCMLLAAIAAANCSQAAMIVVKTDAGNGADGRVQENVSGIGPTGATSGGGGTGTIDVRWNGTIAGDKNQNQWGVLRFDLSPANLGGLSRSAIANAELWLVYQRTGPQSGTVDIFGVNADVPGEDDWAESSIQFNNMPGLKFDGTTDSTADATTSPAGRILADTTSLGSVVLTSQVKPPSVADVLAGGTGVVKFSGASLLSFLKAADTDDQVSFLLGTETVQTGVQLRFAQKEATSLDGGAPTGVAGDFAARLVLEVVPEPTSFLMCIVGGVLCVPGSRRRIA